MKPGYLRTVALVAGMALGVGVPQAQAAAGAIPWLVAAMLFTVFLDTRLAPSSLRGSHWLLLGVNLVMGFMAWGAGWLIGGREVALAAFFAGITPTATAAPVVTSLLRGRVDYVVAAFLVTNLAIAALLPLLLPLVVGHAAPAVFADVLRSVALVVFAPMAGAWLLRKVFPSAAAWPRHLRDVTLGMWVAVLFLVTANGAHFLQTHPDLAAGAVIRIAGLTAVVCGANFALGRLIGRPAFAREASQALGQKNNAFTIYLALNYAGPLAALGPTCYVVWHNLWNSWQIHRTHRHP